jgi:hypothetical protein
MMGDPPGRPYKTQDQIDITFYLQAYSCCLCLSDFNAIALATPQVDSQTDIT